MVGHSIGALYARKVYAAACGENPKEAPFEEDLKGNLKSFGAKPLEEKPRPWASAVDRIVLLAGMNRGWSISHHMSIPRAVVMDLGVVVGRLLDWIYGRPPVIFSIRRGSPFITQLRLQWLSMRKHAKNKNVGGAATIQLLGTVDDLVSPADNIDLISGRDFAYLEVPQSGHRSVIDMDDTDAGMKRQAILKRAFNDANLHAFEVSPGDAFLPIREDVTDVVFVIHGIRDLGYWTQKIARRVQAVGKKHHRVFAFETSSYGYFPMLSFLHPGARQEKVEWLMDRYTEAKATYPNAKFHFFGHSHGTYLLAKAVEQYPIVKFEQVVFAGSVVNTEYKWQDVIPDRVKSVLNFVATRDWVVAFFPKALQGMGIQDLGSAGHDGFKAAKANSHVIQIDDDDDYKYITGGHSAAVQEPIWDSIAEFIVTGQFQPPVVQLRSRKQAAVVVYPAMVAPLLWVVAALILVGILYGLLLLPIREWKKTVAVIAYVVVILTILTKV